VSAKNLNAPQHWAAWIVACQKDEWSSKRLGPLPAAAALTGTDVRALNAIAHCWALYPVCDGQLSVIMAVRALLLSLQPKCWPFARVLIAQSMDWPDCDKVWRRVTETWPGDILTEAAALEHVCWKRSEICGQPMPCRNGPCIWCKGEPRPAAQELLGFTRLNDELQKSNRR
jgi:hypothetical protein